MHRSAIFSINVIGLCLAGVLACPLSAQAQPLFVPPEEAPSVRAKKYEVFAGLGFVRGDKIDSKTPGGTVEIDDYFTGGFGAGYNFTEHLNFNFEIFFGGSEYDLALGSSEVELDTTFINFSANLEYYILDAPLTPLLSAGVGVFDSETDDKLSDGFKRGESRVSYGLGAGFRWDIDDKMFLKSVYQIRWTDIERNRHNFELHTFSIYFGFKF